MPHFRVIPKWRFEPVTEEGAGLWLFSKKLTNQSAPFYLRVCYLFLHLQENLKHIKRKYLSGGYFSKFSSFVTYQAAQARC